MVESRCSRGSWRYRKCHRNPSESDEKGKGVTKMDDTKLSSEVLLLKLLLFQMYSAGMTQDAISKYLGKSKVTINQMLKPLPKKEK
jgi:hypothetical protein